ncbi:MAG: SAM-dependent DNA methyltransferase [Sandaracinus sp.]|nr:SAM-dependent DNA methyltransferase [Sandaracinus sp.]
MPALSTDLRKQLESAIKEARRVAEPGARKALEALAVERHEPHGSMSPAERGLRNRLRAHGRQLGDVRDRDRGSQTIDRLVREVAYEHWHRMLFARFLAENQLLIEPVSGVAISMAECEELAREQGDDAWAFAGRAAAGMLPRIFRPDDPALEVALAPETRQALERLLESLPAEVFTADDSLGWTYQFWQAERKDEVNASGVKIGADELPAVTQLFTEHYMVLFLFHNTIGAWRAGKLLAERPELAREAASEDELRRAVRLETEGGYDFDYLRFVRELEDGGEPGDTEAEPVGPWRPAAGAFEGWPRRAADLRVLDPCCGSGHFLVEGLGLLVRLRMEEEGLARDDAIRAVLAENLFGLELDPRCTQIAAFNLALAAWKLAGRPIELPPLQIACSGLAIGASKPEWLALAGGDERLRGGMARLYELFHKAPELGSLIDPHALTRDQQDLLAAELPDLEPLLVAALEREGRDEARVERAVAAQGMAHAAGLLAGHYTLVITNVPYLGRGNQTATLRKFAEEHHAEAKADLATIFLSRAFRWVGKDGTQAVVTPQNWLFLTSYKRLREKLLSLRTWNLVARLGPGAFETIGGQVVNVALSVLSAGKSAPGWQMAGLDVSAQRGERPILAREKAALLRGDRSLSSERRASSDANGSPVRICQAEQLDNPDFVVLLESGGHRSRLGDYAHTYQGVGTADASRYIVRHWEVLDASFSWVLYQMAPDSSDRMSGCHSLIRWEGGNGSLAKSDRARVCGQPAWGHHGVGIAVTSTLPRCAYVGVAFDCTLAVVIPSNPTHLPAIGAFVLDDSFPLEVHRVDQALSVTESSFEKVPFDLAHWQKVAAEKYPNGLPEPQSDDPTQWLFHGHPAKAEPEAALQVAVARLLGYRWPPEHDAKMRLAAEARAWVARCGELAQFADDDGIVCLPALRGEAGAADRLRRLLAAAFGGAWSGAKERELLAAAAGGGKAAESLEEWLRERFFEEHCKRFHHRPFVWHVWDGRRDGFHALVSYHRLAGPGGEGRRTLEALTYSYLGDWIARQKAEQREGREGADARLAAAQDLQAQLERILEGEPPCDLFVRWKALHAQPIGWEPDLDDGVRINIRPFLRAELRTGGRKGAGLLRWKPNIKWGKDRGKEPQRLRPREEFPWFWSCPGEGSEAVRTDFGGGAEFDGNRWNDLHYTTAVKREARESKRREPGA